MGKTVIFGGTFNPVHTGHVEMATAAVAYPEVEELLVIPTRLPVHKHLGTDLVSGEHRMEMCRLAFGELPNVRFSDMELKSKEKNYSLTTVLGLKREFPKKDFAFLIGGDSLIHFNTWYEYRSLLKEIELYVFGRGSCSDEDFDNALKVLRGEGGHITVLGTKISNISSSEIRERIRAGKPLDELVASRVQGYIKEQGLYLEVNAFDN